MTGSIVRRPRSLRGATGATALVALLTVPLVAGCSEDEPVADPDRLVLTPAEDGAGHTHAPGESDAQPIGDGTTAAAGGYRMVDVTLPRRADGPGDISFRILDRAGAPVTDYVEEQTKLLHLYVVRSDYAVFRHLHPTLAADGTWTVRADLGAPGSYRVLAEFHPTGSDRPVALGAEGSVAGGGAATSGPSARPVSAGATADDGVVRVAAEGPGAVDPDGRLSLLVTDREGRPLELGSYLGSFAHLTGFHLAERGGGGFVHVHPYGAPELTDDGTRLVFHTSFDTAGSYRFFVQVRVEGLVHTVPVTVEVAPAG